MSGFHVTSKNITYFTNHFSTTFNIYKEYSVEVVDIGIKQCNAVIRLWNKEEIWLDKLTVYMMNTMLLYNADDISMEAEALGDDLFN